jgi:hypothetical protein
LFSEAFLRAILPTRIATARRTLRQLGLVLVEVEAGGRSRGSGRDQRVDLTKVAGIVARTLRDSDIAVRLEDGRFALLLEFTPVEGCVVVAERLQRTLDRELPDLVSWSGLACYPAHAIDDTELLTAAANALADARQAGPSAVAVAPVAD